MNNFKVQFVDSIAAIGYGIWQRVAGNDYPFTRYEFLHALETAGADTNDGHEPGAACTRASGWAPHHAVVSDADGIVALMPMYKKYHSYGEYIFDWGWAEAYERNGLSYYPKLLAAIPYSPVTGPRLLLDSAAIASGRAELKTVLHDLCGALQQQCAEHGASSFHLLYPERELNRAFAGENFFARHSFQYHWFNCASGGTGASAEGGIGKIKFTSFNDFCGSLKARKRKAISKERQQVARQGLVIKRLVGEQIDSETWHRFYLFYQLTYAKRSGHGGYLNQAFFETLGHTMGEQVMLVVAERNGELIAAALNLFSSSTLYGRYWGCAREAEFLHFEVCYYQGIEFCIERGLDRFDAGAQGEHKIQRGFRPVDTWSNHYIVHEDFRRAIKDYIAKEQQQNAIYMDQAEQLLPFRATAKVEK